MSLTTADRQALADLVARYAANVDQRSAGSALALFTDDAVLGVPAPPDELGPTSFLEGPDIAVAMQVVERYPMTKHEIVGQLFDETEDPHTATGRISCIAHHLRRNSAGELEDLIWHLTYADTYRESGGTWRYARREITIDWIERRTPRSWRIAEA
ncbi:nuclear transport factor 2 family protein [Saccharopolyspora sp. WRP15-2]|uniref:Nuclear transport factor 2 family protein n=1 Tax=Saccharopolyspora oryzae TaxID=2997343 RepID=A0ABT4V990_9PSEU|nr:nuclear transport factor 2 family protein [Saccharopolyspora oryzae]MDA3630522.1 nuclear transport factor 2 family protein [Saccharopolyspora oryzae]